MITEFSKAVCVPEPAILEKKNRRGGSGRLSDLRQIYWNLLHENGFSYLEIGNLCERDRVTVYQGIKRVKQLLESGDRETVLIYELTKHIKR